MITQELQIEPNRPRGTYKFYATQGESGARTLVFDLLDGSGQSFTPPDGSRALLYVIKPDRNVAVIEGDIASTKVSVTLTLQASAYPGTCVMLLQIIADNGETRYDNMELVVASAPIEGLISRSDFGPLATLLNDAGQIKTTLERITAAYTTLKEIYNEYTVGTVTVQNEFSLYDAENTSDSCRCKYDANGNILLVDWNETKNKRIMLSPDNAFSWTPCKVFDNDDDEMQIMALVGGKKFLMFGAAHNLVWAHAEKNMLVVDKIFNNFNLNIDGNGFVGKYLNGKYWVINKIRMVDTAGYFEEDTNVFVPVKPGDDMVPGDVAFDAASGFYYMTGGYNATSGTLASTGWLARSDDLLNWDIIATFSGVSYGWRNAVTVRNGIVNVYEGRYNSFLVIKSYDLNTGATKEITTFINDGYDSSGYMQSVALVNADVVYGGRDTLIYTKNGVDFEKLSLNINPLKNGFSDISSFGRSVLASCFNEQRIVRIDLAGETVIDQATELVSVMETKISEVNDLKLGYGTWVEEKQEEIQNQLGLKIVVQSSTVAIPDTADEGTILLVYRE